MCKNNTFLVDVWNMFVLNLIPFYAVFFVGKIKTEMCSRNCREILKSTIN